MVRKLNREWWSWKQNFLGARAHQKKKRGGWGGGLEINVLLESR